MSHAPTQKVPGYNVDRIDVAAGLRELKVCGYDEPKTIMVVEYALQRWARGEEEAAQKGAIDSSFHGISLTCWLRVLAAARAATEKPKKTAKLHPPSPLCGLCGRPPHLAPEDGEGCGGDDAGCAGCVSASTEHPCRTHGCTSWCRRHYAQGAQGPYGPYNNGDLVQLLVNTGVPTGGLLFGIVYQAGEKSFRVLWESDHKSRYDQDYHLDRASFVRGMEDFKVEIKTKLSDKLRKLKSP